MVLGNFNNYLSRPNFLFNELITIVYTDDKVYWSPINYRFLLSYIKVKKERVLMVWIYTKWKLSLLYSCNRFRVSIDFVNAKLEFICWVIHHYFYTFHFQELVILYGNYFSNIKERLWRFNSIQNWWLQLGEAMLIRMIFCIL